MLERRSPLHQGMALHMSDASTAGLRVLAVLHSASGAAAEQAVLWPLCAQLQRLGQKVLVLDGSQAESFHTPGLAQLLAQHAWQAQVGLRASVGDAQSVASLPARMGLKQLKASADEMGLDMLTALQAYVRGYTTVIIYASSETLTPLLQGQGLQPLLVVPPDSEHLLESYRQLKHLAVFAGVECTIAALEGPLTADSPQKYDWSRKQSSSQTAKQNAQTRLQRLNALLQCSQRHLGDAPVLLRLRWRQASDLHQLTLHMLKTACTLPMHAQPTTAAAPESLVWSH
ncbi:hypothetical protein QYQ99_13450 [Comamonas testosteroni]|uniref:hypothetical protein n=1 Tax=Comamonas testosteroni TaxID=285 RepID=UPI002660554C|nr:hypothetical protein [Comamonas testosteroni]WKL18468.1 hypothetical protein QYQ99_13450 [Comamonas testosteroni]